MVRPVAGGWGEEVTVKLGYGRGVFQWGVGGRVGEGEPGRREVSVWAWGVPVGGGGFAGQRRGSTHGWELSRACARNLPSLTMTGP